MSFVTSVGLAYGPTRDAAANHRLLAEVNALNDAGSLTHVEDPRLPDRWFSNGKGMEVNLAVGVFNYLELGRWVGAMRESVDFPAYGCRFVQLMVQGESDDGFGIIEVWRGAGAPFDADAFEETVEYDDDY